jgi:hypothetical protein
VLVAAPATLSASAVHAAAVYQASASLVAAPASLAASATRTVPASGASVALVAAPATLSTAAAFATSLHTAAVVLVAAPASLSAVATFVAAPPPPPVASTLTQALRERLLAAGSLTGLTAVYLSFVPSGAVLPYIILDYPQTVPSPHGAGYWEIATAQFTVMAGTAAEAYRIGMAAWSELAPGLSDSPLLFADGEEFQRRIPGIVRGPFRQPDVGPGGRSEWSFVFTYRLALSRPYRGGLAS